MRIKEFYRLPAEWGAHVYFLRWEDGSSLLDKHGEPERFNYSEHEKIMAGAAPSDVIAARAKVAPPVAAVAPAKRRGRG